MNQSAAHRLGSKALIIGVAHVALAILGVYNLLSNGSYVIEAWGSLNSQGIGHVYLAIAAVLCCWWLGIAILLNFMGNAMMPRLEEKLTLKGVIRPIVGAGVSLVVPYLMIVAWLMVIVWIRSLFSRARSAKYVVPLTRVRLPTESTG